MKICSVAIVFFIGSTLWAAQTEKSKPATIITKPSFLSKLDGGKHQPDGRQLSTHRPNWVQDVTYLDLDGDGDR